MRKSDLKKLNEIDVSKKAYIAGILDGEGCINISKLKKSPVPFLQIWIDNTCPEVIDFIYNETGVGSRGCRTDKKRPHAKLVYFLIIRGPVARAFLETVGPFLVIKKEHCELAIQFQKFYDARPYNDLKSVDQTVAMKYYQKMKMLNNRTVAPPSWTCDIKRRPRKSALANPETP